MTLGEQEITMTRETRILRDALDKIYANAAESPEWIRAVIMVAVDRAEQAAVEDYCAEKYEQHKANNNT
jgi:hypothetical protein